MVKASKFRLSELPLRPAQSGAIKSALTYLWYTPLHCFAGEFQLRLREIIRAPKSEIEIGKWRAGKVPKSDFPLFKNAYNLGSAFKWNVITFQALGAECRVLVVFNAGKQKYEAILGVMGSRGIMRVLCSYEYHASEPGWHCHATHDDSESLSNSFMRGPWVKRIPSAKKLHRQPKFAKFTIGDEVEALRFALRRYKIDQKGSLL